MEFFAIADIKTTAEQLQAIGMDELDRYCEDIDQVVSVDDENSATVYCVWGEFLVQRQAIRGGIRFTMPSCPNAMSWTLTTGHEPAPDRVVVHATINRTGHDPDFIESIEDWVAAWKDGLEKQPGERDSVYTATEGKSLR